MKFIVSLTILFCFGSLSGQNSQEYIFKFNVKNWNREFIKQKKLNPDKSAVINLFDVYGNAVKFKMQEKSTSEVAAGDLKIFKGKSDDDLKLISLTIQPKSMSGAYLQNGVQYFIEPLKGSCNTYKVYTNPVLNKNIEVGQINDHIK